MSNLSLVFAQSIAVNDGTTHHAIERSKRRNDRFWCHNRPSYMIHIIFCYYIRIDSHLGCKRADRTFH
jgi:hypothetical protein